MVYRHHLGLSIHVLITLGAICLIPSLGVLPLLVYYLCCEIEVLQKLYFTLYSRRLKTRIHRSLARSYESENRVYRQEIDEFVTLYLEEYLNYFKPTKSSRARRRVIEKKFPSIYCFQQLEAIRADAAKSAWFEKEKQKDRQLPGKLEAYEHCLCAVHQELKKNDYPLIFSTLDNHLVNSIDNFSYLTKIDNTTLSRVDRDFFTQSTQNAIELSKLPPLFRKIRKAFSLSPVSFEDIRFGISNLKISSLDKKYIAFENIDFLNKVLQDNSEDDGLLICKYIQQFSHISERAQNLVENYCLVISERKSLSKHLKSVHESSKAALKSHRL